MRIDIRFRKITGIVQSFVMNLNMKLIPTKNQWKGWTLPSKASYAGLIVGIVSLLAAIIFFAIQFLASLQQDNYKKNVDKPKIIIGTQNKPYLRYEIINDKKISFSYELKFQNNGTNTAVDIKHAKISQKLVINGNTIVDVVSDSEVSLIPSQLVSGDKFFKIYKLNGKQLDKNEIQDLIKKYSNEELSIVLDINIEYKDEITNAIQNTHEILNIFKNKVLILN